MVRPEKSHSYQATRGYPDLRDHLEILDKAGLLVRVKRLINKDTEMHPLVRWQFRGGIPEAERKGFLFENIVDAKGRHYDMKVAVGVIASNRKIYSVGMGCEVEEIAERWRHAKSNPIRPVVVKDGPCQEIAITGDEQDRPGKGLDLTGRGL